MLDAKTNKGQFTILPVIITAIATIFASGLGAWGISSKRVAGIETQVQVVKTTEDLHYKELKSKTDEISKDVKEILKRVK